MALNRTTKRKIREAEETPELEPGAGRTVGNIEQPAIGEKPGGNPRFPTSNMPGGPDVTPVTRVPGKPNIQAKFNLMIGLLDNMLDGTKVKIMLAGDTGIGKTSFVRMFAQLLGLEMMLVEVPHTVEEHLINIPFIIVSPDGTTKNGHVDVAIGPEEGDQKFTEKQANYEIALARSNLVTTLDTLNKIPNAQYRNYLLSLPQYMQDLYQAVEEEYPGEIQEARNKYSRILFLDEYFRQTSTAIRNSLRNILDFRIGQDQIPDGTYIMYASNIADKGLDIEQSSHATFKLRNFQAPTVIEWLNSMITGKAGKTIQFKKDVIDAFIESLNDEHLSKERLEGQVRISPRRWSEILLQINAEYPFSDAKSASLLVSTLSRQFENEDKNTHGEMTDAYEVLQNILKKLYVKSGFDIAKIKKVLPKDWREVVAYHVMQKEKMGENKKYVPVIQGPPGIGKTSLGLEFEKPPYNMRFIVINSTDLDPDSVIGIPVSKTVNGERVTSFSKPTLYMQIEKLMARQTAAYRYSLMQQEKAGELNGKTAEEVYRDWENQKYRFVIFFDEINRVKNLTVFNSLRRLILEKEFNHEYKLGDDIIVLGAMNPDDKGTIGMTDHFKDAVDLIDSEPDWDDTINYIRARGDQYRNTYMDVSVDTALKVLEAFPRTFTQKTKERRNHQFYVRLGEAAEFYINPRDYDELFKSLCYSINREVKSVIRKIDAGANITDAETNARIVKTIMPKFHETLSNLFFKGNYEAPEEFWERLEMMVKDEVEVSLAKTSTRAGLSSMIEYAISSNTPLKDDGNFYDYLEEYMPAAFHKDFYHYVDDKVKSFLDGDGTDIDLSQAEDFLMSDKPGSLYDIVNQMAEAVEEHDFETGIYDDIEDVSYEILNRANKAIGKGNGINSSDEEDAVMRLISNYKRIMKRLGKI